MKNIIEKIKALKIVPVVVVEEAEDVIPLGEVLSENGLPVAEITFRSKGAEQAIRLLKRHVPDMLVGAGTLLTTAAIQSAADAGADFFVSPGFNPKTVAFALQNDLFMVPGVTNRSLVEQALDMGVTNLKYFPASVAGGPGMLNIFDSVYPEATFMPTGGISARNISEYLSLGNVFACGGSWMVQKDMISSHQWDTIASTVREAVGIVQNI